MARRIHVRQRLAAGIIKLDPQQAHHVRDVLRMTKGDALELFDDDGNVANAAIESCDEGVSVRVEEVKGGQLSEQIVIASAVPKGNRADWMVEKLSELGVSRFIPMKTARSVVLPAGRGKYERWRRIAEESAKQSRRQGVMQIDELTPLEKVIQDSNGKGVFLSTESNAAPFIPSSSFILHPSSFLLVGPEGGWTDDEIQHMKSANLTGAKLTTTILRVETAAVVAAAVALVR